MVVFHEPLLQVSEALLRKGSTIWRGHESVLYWAGMEMDNKWVLSTCIRPVARTTRGSFQTSTRANAEVISFLAAHQLGLLAQVHTHPGSFIDHSEGDDEGAFMAFENFISIVVPDYGRQGILPLTQCGVHRMENGQFRRLRVDEINQSFRILPLAQDFGEKYERISRH